jgi:hypothetical protein
MASGMYIMAGRQDLPTPQWQDPRLLSVICRARWENIHGTKINLSALTLGRAVSKIPDQIKLGANCVSTQLQGRPLHISVPILQRKGGSRK